MSNSSLSFLKTNHGEHGAEIYAYAAADRLIHFDPDTASTDTVIAAKKLESAVAALLEPHHQAVLTGEKAQVEAQPKRMLEGYSPDDHADLDAIVGQIAAAAVGTPWESNFASDLGKLAIAREVRSMMATAMHVTRHSHADRNKHLPEAAQLIASRQGPVPTEAPEPTTAAL